MTTAPPSPPMLAVVPLRPPRRGELTLYVGGGADGYGECQVLVTPGRGVVVVDACASAGCLKPLDLLDALGLLRVDLLVVTHWDTDHCGGLASLLGRVSPARVWHAPYGSLHVALARVLQQAPAPPARLRVLREALDALDRALSTGVATATEANLSTRVWGAHGVRVSCLAPCARDQRRAGAELSSFVAWVAGVPELARAVERFVTPGAGAANPARVNNNALSLALSVQWGQVRVVLGGDVEAPGPLHGWDGILTDLQRDNRLDEVRAPALIKLSHHGSQGAVCERAWGLHSSGAHRPDGVLTPYRRGVNNPPQAAALEGFRRRVSRLGATAPPEPTSGSAPAAPWSRFAGAGWSMAPTPAASGVEVERWLGVAYDAQGRPTYMAAPGARWFSL